ncbi:hypothetical protein [Leptobacterium sp. I13]|uniref:hypothetical protein n=1 Tax=Leptobacterium meishanense TaxID=3128904 RepID=UPI0030ECAD85
MKFITLHNNYLNPISGQAFENVFITDGFLKDDPDNKRLEVSLRLQHKKLVYEIDFSGENPSKIQVEKTETIAETVLVFDSFERPTMVTIDNNQVNLFQYLEGGGQLQGDEEILVGYPTYASAQKYFVKDNLGDKLIINPALEALYQKLATLFILEGKDKNGRPIGFFGENIGVQFNFE